MSCGLIEVLLLFASAPTGWADGVGRGRRPTTSGSEVDSPRRAVSPRRVPRPATQRNAAGSAYEPVFGTYPEILMAVCGRSHRDARRPGQQMRHEWCVAHAPGIVRRLEQLLLG